MAVLKSEAKEDLSSFTDPSAHQELEHWEKIVFAFDMDRDQSSNPGNDQGRRSTSVPNTNNTGTGIDPHDAALLAQFAAAGSAGFNAHFANVLPHGQYPPQMNPTANYYGSLFHPPPPQLPPLASLDFAWHGYPGANPPSPSNQFHPHLLPPNAQASGSHLLPQHLQTLQPQASQRPAQGVPGPSSTAQPGAGSSSQAQSGTTTTSSSGSGRNRRVSSADDMTEAERTTLAEEKRRRNTAASARFRVKKKHKTITLERSVSDLTGRAEELEREAADLRRENGWLKEIVMLKGSRFAANNFNHRLALGQAAALATGQAILPVDLMAGPSSRQVPGNGAEESSSDEEEDEEDEEDEVDASSKGKGKQRSKK